MAVANTDIHFYHSLAADGGDIDTGNEIISDSLNSFIGDVSAADSESGVVKRTKFYVKNEHATDSLYLGSLGLSSFSLGDDYFALYESTGNSTTTGDETFTRRYGVAHTTGEMSGLTIAIEFEDPTMYTDIFQPGDTVTFFNSSNQSKICSGTIDTVTSTSLTVLEDLTANVLDNSYVSTIAEAGTIAAGGYAGFWLEQVVLPYSGEQLSNTMNLTFYFDPVE